MTDAEARDDPADRPPRWHPWLMVLFAATMVPRAIDDVTAALATRLLHTPWLFWLPLLTGAIEILGLFVAGTLIDRYGIRVVAGRSLLVWAVIIAGISLFVRDSPLLYLVHDCALFAGLFFALAVSVAAKLAAPFARRARFLATLELASDTWLVGVPLIASSAGWPPAAPHDWPIGGLGIAGGGALLAILWWTARSPVMVPPDIEAGGPQTTPSVVEVVALLRRPGILALTLVAACHLVMFSTVYRVLPVDVVRMRFLPAEAFQRALIGPFVAFALVKMALAFWSDGRARRTGSPAASRVPFVVAGAAFAATIGLLPFVDNAHLGLILWPLAVGMAAFPLVFTLALDVVPAALAGRFLGLTIAIAMAITMAVFVLANFIAMRTHDFSWYFHLAGLAGVAAAVLSLAVLRRLQPVEDHAGFVRAVGKVFA